MKDLGLIFIVGPSSVGKSEIGLDLADRLKAEIICCDAMQVYQEISIASDKPNDQARNRIPHHLMGIVSVSEEFNAARFRVLALQAIQEIHSRGKTPLIIGGSGMYMTVLLDGIFEGAVVGEGVREELTQELKNNGPAYLHGRLKKLDPLSAAKIHPNDPQRILRALEVVQSTGQTISSLQQKRECLWGKMPIKIFALNRPRQELYQRLEARVEKMFINGLLEEIKKVSQLPLSLTARKIIGIPEVLGHLNGDHDLERAKYLMKLHTRHFVKRQLTWFRRDKRLIWVDIAPHLSTGQITDIIGGAL